MRKLLLLIFISLLVINIGCDGGSGGDGSGEPDNNANVVNITPSVYPDYTNIKISWDSFGDSYSIYRSVNGGEFQYYMSTFLETSFTDNSAKIGSSYKYKIKNSSDNTITHPSKIISLKAIEIPGTFTVTADSYSNFDISFSLIPANEYYYMKYQIQKSADNVTFSTIKTYYRNYSAYSEGDTETFSDTSVDSGTTYYYRIHSEIDNVYNSTNPDGFYSISNVIESSITPPPPPNDFEIDTSEGAFTLNWTAMDNIQGYKIYRSEDNSNFTEIRQIYSSATENYTDDTAGPGVTYYYKISSYVGPSYDEREGEMSDSISGSIPVGSYVPDSPQASSGTTLEINWTDISGCDFYRLYRSTSSDGTYVQVENDFPFGTTSFVDYTVTIEEYYYYKISVVKSGIESLKSDWTIGRQVKYGPDTYENDDSVSFAHEINLYFSSVIETHTIDMNDYYYSGDHFIVYNKSSSSKSIKVTFTSLDLNGNSKIRVSSGFDNADITAVDDSVTSSSSINPDGGWTFQISRPIGEYNTSSYTIRVELVF